MKTYALRKANRAFCHFITTMNIFFYVLDWLFMARAPTALRLELKTSSLDKLDLDRNILSLKLKS